MLYLLMILLIILIFLSFFLLDRDILAPAVVVCAVFFVSTVGCIINSRYWQTRLSIETIAVIVGGCFIFLIVAVLCKMLNQRVYGMSTGGRKIEISEITIDSKIVLVVLLINALLVVSQFYFVESVAALSSTDLLTWGKKMEYYRNVVSYGNSSVRVFAPSYINLLEKITTVLAYIFLYININNFLCESEKKWWRKIRVIDVLPIVANIFFNLICSERGAILMFFLATVTIFHLLYHQKNGWCKQYSVKLIIKLVLLVIIILAVFVGLRDVVGRNYSETARNPIYYLCCYIGGPIHLLDDFIKNPPVKSDILGKETFYSVIRFWGQRLGKPEWIYVSHLEFRYSNGLNVGNVYTAFRKYIYDFGYFGVVWCTALVSFVYNVLYYNIRYGKKKRKCFDVSILFFGYISYGYYYMSIQERPLSAVLCTTTLVMPILFVIVTYFMTHIEIGRKIKLHLRRRM